MSGQDLEKVTSMTQTGAADCTSGLLHDSALWVVWCELSGLLRSCWWGAASQAPLAA